MDIEGVLDVVKDGFIETRFTFSTLPKHLRTYRLEFPLLDVIRTEDTIILKCPGGRPICKMEGPLIYTVHLRCFLTIDQVSFYVRELNKYSTSFLGDPLKEKTFLLTKSENYTIEMKIKPDYVLDHFIVTKLN